MAKDLTPKYPIISASEEVVLPEDTTGFGAKIGGLGGRLEKTVVDSINVDGNFIKEVINDKLDTDAQTILAE